MNEIVDLTDVYILLRDAESANDFRRIMGALDINNKLIGTFDFPSVSEYLHIKVPEKIETHLYSSRTAYGDINFEVVLKKIDYSSDILCVIIAALRQHKIELCDNLQIKINLRHEYSPTGQENWLRIKPGTKNCIRVKLYLTESLDGNLAYRILFPDKNGILPGEPNCDNDVAMQLYPWRAIKDMTTLPVNDVGHAWAH